MKSGIWLKIRKHIYVHCGFFILIFPFVVSLGLFFLLVFPLSASMSGNAASHIAEESLCVPQSDPLALPRSLSFLSRPSGFLVPGNRSFVEQAQSQWQWPQFPDPAQRCTTSIVSTAAAAASEHWNRVPWLPIWAPSSSPRCLAAVWSPGLESEIWRLTAGQRIAENYHCHTKRGQGHYWSLYAGRFLNYSS